MTSSMTLLLWLAKGTVVLLLAMALTLGLRRAPAGARYLVWLASLAALLLVPALSTWISVPLPVLPPTAVATQAIVTPDNTAAASIPRADESPSLPAGPAANVAARSRRPTPVQRATLDFPQVVLMAWAAVAALLFGWLALGALKVRRIVRDGRALTGNDWLMPMYDVADRLDLPHAPRLVMSDAVEMPFACGVLRPTIVLPPGAESWSVERRRVVLFHELAHVRRRDLLGHTVGRITCALYWFHPLVWSAAKRLRAESERACDDLVLACGGARASDYATHLLDIVTGVRRQGAPATALPMADRKEFEGRMLAILDATAKRTTPSRLQQVGVTLGFGALALSTAAVAPTAQRATIVEHPYAASTATLGDAAPTGTVTSLRRERVTPARTAPAATPAARPDPAAVSGTRSAPAQLGQPLVESQVSRDAIIDRVAQSAQGRQAAAPDTGLLGRVLRTDKDGGVRKAAAWALQGRRDGVPLLLERLRVDGDDGVREMSAWALAHMPSEAVATALAEALTKDRSEDVRGTAAWALGHMPTRANLPALEGALSDDSESVRQRALWAIGHHRLEAAPKRIVDLLQDSEQEVRVMAAWVLGEIRDKSTAVAIREAFGKERDHEVQEAEFRTLLLLGDRSQALIDRAMASEDPDIRARAVRVIAGQGGGSWPWPWPWPEPRPEP